MRGRPEQEGFPSFFPDGSRILFHSRVADYLQLFSIATDGSDLTQLTRGDFDNACGHVSPDEGRIVLHSDQSEPGNVDAREIYLMNLDGSGRTRLTENEARDGYPKWSPDGEKILFHSTRRGAFEVWDMNADGSRPRQLTGIEPPPARSQSPDG